MGGVIREAKGQWIVGFRKATGMGKVINAKLWAVFTGLELAWSKGFKKVEVKSDNMQVVRLNNNRGLAAIVTMVTLQAEMTSKSSEVHLIWQKKWNRDVNLNCHIITLTVNIGQ